MGKPKVKVEMNKSCTEFYGLTVVTDGYPRLLITEAAIRRIRDFNTKKEALRLWELWKDKLTTKKSQTTDRRGKIMDEAKSINNALEKIRAEHPSWSRTKASADYFRKVVARQVIRPSNIDSHDMKWLKNLHKAKIFILKDGWLQIPRWDNGQRIPQLVKGVDAAYRMQKHILDGYLNGVRQKTGELEKIKSLEEIIQKINLFLRNWPMVKSHGQEQEIRELTATAILALEQSRNFFKVNALGQIEEVNDMEDSRQRENPGAMAARTIAALNNLSLRLVEVGAIIPAISIRKQILELEIRRLEGRIRQALGKIIFIQRMVPTKKAPGAYVHQARILIGETDKILNTIWVSPYRERKIQARAKLALAKDLVGINIPQAKIHLKNAAEILKSALH